MMLQCGNKILAVALMFYSVVSVYAADLIETNYPVEEQKILSSNKELLKNLIARWAGAWKIEKAELGSICEDIAKSDDIAQAIAHVVEKMTSCGTNASEIKELMSQYEFEIPSSAKLDWGMNEQLGGLSFMGSFDANMKAASKQGLLTWCSNNTGIIFSYFTSFHIMASIVSSPENLSTDCGATKRR